MKPLNQANRELFAALQSLQVLPSATIAPGDVQAALVSLSKYPREVRCAADAYKLSGFNDAIIAALAHSNILDFEEAQHQQAQNNGGAGSKPSNDSKPSSATATIDLLSLSSDDEPVMEVDMRPLAERLAGPAPAAAATAGGKGATSASSQSVPKSAGNTVRSPATSSSSSQRSTGLASQSVAAVRASPAKPAATGASAVGTGDASSPLVSAFEPAAKPPVKRRRSTSAKAPAAAAGASSVAAAAAASTVAQLEAAVSDADEAWTCPCCERRYKWIGSGSSSNSDVVSGSSSSSSNSSRKNSSKNSKAGWVCETSGRRADGAWAQRSAGCFADSSSSSSSSSPSLPHGCVLDAANWEVVLLIDNREVRSRADRGYLQQQLASRGVPCEVRQLPLGDMLWVARRKIGAPRPAKVPEPQSAADAADSGAQAKPAAAGSKGKKKKAAAAAADEADPSSSSSSSSSAAAAVAVPAAPKKKRSSAKAPPPPPWEPFSPQEGEWVLDMMVERKAVADLAASLVDGRYAEQKLRLAETGMRVVYIVEGNVAALAMMEAQNAAVGVGGGAAGGGAGPGLLRRWGSTGPGGGSGGGRGGFSGPRRPPITTKHINGAMISTTVHNGYAVVSTHTLDHTVAWLVRTHHAVAAQFKRGAMCQHHHHHHAVGGGGGGQQQWPPGAGAGSGSSSSSSNAIAFTQVDDGDDDVSIIGGSSSAAGAFGFSQSHAAMAFSQAAAETAEAACDPFCLIGGGLSGGASPADSGGGSSGSGPNSSSSSSSSATPPAHLCRYDRCNLWGRPGLPRVPRSYADFAAAASKPKTFTAKRLFGMMLRQIQGCSADRAQAILEVYPTPAALCAAYDALGDTRGRDGPGLLRNLQIPRQRNTLGPTVSAAIYNTFYTIPPPLAPAAASAGNNKQQTTGGGSGGSNSAGGGSGYRLGGGSDDDDDDDDEAAGEWNLEG